MQARSLEVKMAAHVAANELRDQGKPIWQARIDIQSSIRREPNRKDADYCIALGFEVGDKLLRGLPKSILNYFHEDFDPEIDGLIEEITTLFDDGDVPVFTEFNDIMRRIYNWADVARVWLGR